MTRCWNVSYYFRIGHRKRLYRGYYVSCITGANREDVIRGITPEIKAELDAGRTLVKVCASPKAKGHDCFLGVPS